MCVYIRWMYLCIQACINVFLPNRGSNLTDKITIEAHFDFECTSYACQGHSSHTTVTKNKVSCGIRHNVRCGGVLAAMMTMGLI